MKQYLLVVAIMVGVCELQGALPSAGKGHKRSNSWSPSAQKTAGLEATNLQRGDTPRPDHTILEIQAAASLNRGDDRDPAGKNKPRGGESCDDCCQRLAQWTIACAKVSCLVAATFGPLLIHLGAV